MNAFEKKLKSVADAIRKRKGTTELINAEDYEEEILNIASQEIVVESGGSGNIEARVKANSITITKAKVNIIDDTTIELEV